MRITPIRRALAAGASVAVATAGFAALAPAAQAESGTLLYTCSASIYEGQQFTAVVDTNLPETVVQGTTTPVTMTATVVVPELAPPAAPGVLETLRALTVATVEGVATVESTLNDAAQASSILTIPQTAVPATGALTIQASGMAQDFEATTVGTHAVKASSFTGSLVLKKADGTPPIFGSPADLNCVPNEGQDLTIDTVEVTKAAAAQATKTTAKVKYAKKAKKATVSVKVLNKDKTAAAGKVKLTLKKGKKVVGKRTVKLNAKGQAKGAFKKLKKKGKYTLVVQYQGTKTSKKSKRTVKFRVR